METCKSPRKVLLAAYHIARRVLPNYASKFSRHDFTLPQLFACLVLREHQKKSFRGTEALLGDVHWGKQIGMRRTPDHNTLFRAFHAIMSVQRVDKMLDLFARFLRIGMAFGDVLVIDSTYFDTHHHSRHYEYRCRQHASKDKRVVDAKRAEAVKKTPKLALAVEARTHVILAVKTRVGMSGDALDFAPLLRQACRRADNIQTVAADSGYDSHVNHVTAREELGVNALIKADAGRPTNKPAKSAYREVMKHELAGSQKGRPYGHRAQVETVNSMIKRNLGDSLRARSDEARSLEQLLRAITHNVMISRYHGRVETEPFADDFPSPCRSGREASWRFPPRRDTATHAV
jgi:hypothetical protein